MPSFQGAMLGVIGAGGLRVTVNDHTVQNAITFAPATVSAGIKANRDGNIQTGSSTTNVNPTYSNVGGREWASIPGATVGDDYEVRMVTGTGTVSTGSDVLDTWLPLTSDREWKVTRTTSGAKVFTGTLEVRKVGDTAPLDSGAVSLTASIEIV